MSIQGRPFKGILHSTDASAGVEVPITEAGAAAAHTIAADEYVEIHTVSLVAAAEGDGYLFTATAAASLTPDIFVRGTFATNGGEALRLNPPHVAANAHKIYLIAPAGVVDVILTGTVRACGSLVKPSWR